MKLSINCHLQKLARKGPEKAEKRGKEKRDAVERPPQQRRSWRKREALAGGLFAYQLYYAKRRDIFNEFARENLRTTDSICLKIACGVLVLAAVLCVFSDFSGIVVGYALLIGLLALTVARAVLFTVIDKRGM